MVFSSFSFASANEHNEHAKNEIPATHGPIDTPDKINDYIKHHLQDAYSFTLYSYTDTIKKTRNHVGFDLPVILLDNHDEVWEFEDSDVAIKMAEILTKNSDSGYRYYVKKV